MQKYKESGTLRSFCSLKELFLLLKQMYFMKLHFKPGGRLLFKLVFFFIIVTIFIVRACSDTGPESPDTDAPPLSDTLALAAIVSDSVLAAPFPPPAVVASGSKPHGIYSVNDYELAFPDINSVQLATAKYHGIEPQPTRDDLERVSGKSMVWVGYSPYYSVARLTHSLPYLVPRAQKLLSRIGRNFIDSLLVKHLPPSLIVVTSVTRTLEDVRKLKTGNVNATDNSCHSYGTTVDISYSKYRAFKDAHGVPMRQVRDDTLKQVLSEVLNDLRQAGACYVKHERRQGCFHITVR